MGARSHSSTNNTEYRPRYPLAVGPSPFAPPPPRYDRPSLSCHPVVMRLPRVGSNLPPTMRACVCARARVVARTCRSLQCGQQFTRKEGERLNICWRRTFAHSSISSTRSKCFVEPRAVRLVFPRGSVLTYWTTRLSAKFHHSCTLLPGCSPQL